MPHTLHNKSLNDNRYACGQWVRNRCQAGSRYILDIMDLLFWWMFLLFILFIVSLVFPLFCGQLSIICLGIHNSTPMLAATTEKRYHHESPHFGQMICTIYSHYSSWSRTFRAGKIRDLYELAHDAGWELCNLHDLGNVSWVGSELCRSCTTFHNDR